MGHDETAERHDVAASASPRMSRDDSEMGVDISAFDNLVAELGREDTLQTFSIFFDEADNRLKRLRELSCEEERNAVQQQAHGLKGSAANFGLRQVSELAAALEQDARTITAGGYDIAVRSLETSYAAARERFAKLTA
jgi:HPt (histidine-containing phosphotransfer) domain-containing protein